jgi:hypothetical protein
MGTVLIKNYLVRGKSYARSLWSVYRLHFRDCPNIRSDVVRGTIEDTSLTSIHTYLISAIVE